MRVLSESNGAGTLLTTRGSASYVAWDTPPWIGAQYARSTWIRTSELTITHSLPVQLDEACTKLARIHALLLSALKWNEAIQVSGANIEAFSVFSTARDRDLYIARRLIEE